MTVRIVRGHLRDFEVVECAITQGKVFGNVSHASAVRGLGYHGKRFGNDRKYLPLAGIIRIWGALLNDTLKRPAPATQCNPIRRRHTALS